MSAANQKKRVVPIFEKDGNRLFVLAESFLGQNEDEARQIGWGASLVEAVLMGITFTGDVMPIDAPNGTFQIPHVRATLAGTTCCVIGGPLFDEANVPLCVKPDCGKAGSGEK